MTRPVLPTLPRLPLALLRLLLPRAEREEILADLTAEYQDRCGRSGAGVANRWLWRQALHSAKALIGWNWRREWGDYEPPANAYTHGGRMLKHWITDARYAARRLRSRPGYTALAALTLALGIGGTAAVFGIARPVLLDPLPYPNADQVVSFWRPGWWNEEEFLYLRDKFAGFERVAAHRQRDVTIRDGDGPTRLLPGLEVSAELFDVLGARPIVGRTFQKGDDVLGNAPVAVISYGLWQELGGDASVIGTRLLLDGSPSTVIGVMPKGFWFPTPAVRIWSARRLDPEARNGSYVFIGQVSPGLDRAMTPQLARLTQVMKERFTYAERADKTLDPWVKPIRDELLGPMRPALVATFVVMLLILLIACVNVAALMLGQVEGRTAELAVRSALGATRGRITQQLVIEALLIGLIAAGAGGLLASVGFGLLARALPLGAWRESAAFDWTMFAVALGISVVAVLLVVLVPTLSLWRQDLRGRMGQGRLTAAGRGGKLERSLVIGEVAIAMLIASWAGLLVRSVGNLYAIDPGVKTEGVALVSYLTSPTNSARVRLQTIDEVVAAIRRLPGVTAVGSTAKLPLRGGGDSFGITIEGQQEAERTFTLFRIVSIQYFETMGIALKAGRAFQATDLLPPADTAVREVPVVINEALAAKYFPGQDPLGRLMGGGIGVKQRVVGVVANVAEGGLTDAAEPARYYLQEQAGWPVSPWPEWFGLAGVVVIRTGSTAAATAVLDEARKTFQRIAPEFAVQSTTTMDRVLDEAVGPARQIMSLLGLLSGLALVLGAIGIYGVIAHFAARRKRDWAIRVALGLPGNRVVTHIVGQGAVLAGIGIAFGVVGAVLMSRLLATFLYGVSGLDPVAFAAASGVLLIIALAAAFIPARRAGTVDPALVLREQ